MVAGGGFEPPTFGLCDLTHLSMRVGLYLHPRGMLAIQSLRLPPHSGGLVRYCPIARATQLKHALRDHTRSQTQASQCIAGKANFQLGEGHLRFHGLPATSPAGKWAEKRAVFRIGKRGTIFAPSTISSIILGVVRNRRRRLCVSLSFSLPACFVW